MTLRPLTFIWTGKAMEPDARFVALARRQFSEGERYVLEPFNPVSHKERGHYFAAIREAWGNLSPEAVARYPNPEALRKWALIKAGWRKENYTVCDTEERALVLAAFLRRLDSLAVVTVDKCVVRIYVARSQKIGRPEDDRMTLEEWKRSKQDVLDILANQIGVTRKQLEKAT